VAAHPTCAACGTRGVEVHHVEPFHVRPDLELDPANLISLCRADHFCFGHFHRWASWNPDVRADVARYRHELDRRPGVTREELATMTDSEKLDMLLARSEPTAGPPARVVGLDGNTVLPVRADPAPRPPFDWSPWVKALTPILLSFVLAVLSYYGVNLSNKVDTASSHAEAAVKQGEANAVKIDQTHTELKSHGRQLDRITGNVADRVPGM
jgi:hypothetical protein